MKSRGPRTKKSGGALFPKGVDRKLRAWIVEQPCILVGRRITDRNGAPIGGPHECHSPVQVCHIKSRGAGGDDRNNVVSVCANFHQYQHFVGIRTFQARLGVNLKALAKALTAQYEAEAFPCP